MKIQKILTIIIVYLIVIGWKAETHKTFVEKLYYSMPNDLKNKFNLTELKDGSVAPDAIFKDFKYHHYPKSIVKAKLYLKNLTSYNLGIASHYISDSFTAPHNVEGENYKLHAWFESQVEYYHPTTECKDYNLKIDNIESNANDWYLWLKTKNKEIGEREVEEAMQYLYSLIFQLYPDFKCNKESIIEYETIYNTKSMIVSTAMLIIIIYIIKY